MTTNRNKQIGTKQHLTPKQKQDLLGAYVALYVNTQFSPETEAISGPKMVVLENKGLAIRYEVVDKKTLFRLTGTGRQMAETLRLEQGAKS